MVKLEINMNILFRADSSHHIGAGHIMRDLVLAKQFKNDNIMFATQKLDGNINNIIKQNNYKIINISSNDVNEIIAIIKKYKRTHPTRKLVSNNNFENKASLVKILPNNQGIFEINLK